MPSIEKGKLQVLWVTPERLMDSERHCVEALGLMGFGTVVLNSMKRALLRLQNPLVPLPSVVVVNVYDHGWDGFPFIVELRKDPRTRKLPIIALSTDCEVPWWGNFEHSCAALRHNVKAAEVGASAYHEIPVSMEVVAADIRRLARPA